MNKIFKKFLIGILFALLVIPIIGKNNIYAAEFTNIGSSFNLDGRVTYSGPIDGTAVYTTPNIINFNEYSLIQCNFNYGGYYGDNSYKIEVENYDTGEKFTAAGETFTYRDYHIPVNMTVNLQIPSSYKRGKIHFTFKWHSCKDYSGENGSSYASTRITDAQFSGMKLPTPSFTSGATLSPTNLSYSGSTTASYSVAANNTASYTWYLDGSPNPTGANGATYTANIANLSHGNHTLKCVASSSGGLTAETNTITFNVDKTPKISSGNLTHINRINIIQLFSFNFLSISNHNDHLHNG